MAISRPLRCTALAILATTAVLLPSGCAWFGDQGRTSTFQGDARPENRLRGVDWLAVAGPKLGCDSEPEMFKKPVEHDITGDGVLDTFVTLDCYTGNSIYPDHIEVYDGASAPAAPRILGVLTDEVKANFHLKCLTFDGPTVWTRGFVLRGGDPAGAPSLLGARRATWDGVLFHLSGLMTSAAPDGYASIVPGCP